MSDQTKIKEQVLVSITLQNGKSHLVLLDKASFNQLLPLSSASYGLTTLSPSVYLMGKGVSSNKNAEGEPSFYLSSFTLATHVDRISSYEVLSDKAQVAESGYIKLINEDVKPDIKGDKSIVRLEDMQGNDYYIVVNNSDINMLYAGIISEKADILHVTSQDPSLFLAGRELSYNDMGDGPSTGVFYLTGVKLGIYVKNYACLEVIRVGVKISQDGYITGGHPASQGV